MKKKMNFGILALLMLCLFSACSNDDNNEKSIEVAEKQQLDQKVYADETQGKSGVVFTTTAAWTSFITETTTTSLKSSYKSVNPDWVSITPDKGDKAGTYTIILTLMPNYTGIERSATITIDCNGEKIDIKVTQGATDENGVKPVEKEYDLGFLLLIDDNRGNFKLAFTDNVGKITKEIITIRDTCDLTLMNYNDTTKEAYIHRYMSFGDSIPSISEFYSVNVETLNKKYLVNDLPSFDQAFISADGNYVVYDKIKTEEIYKQSLIDGEISLLYEAGASIRAISNNGSLVVLTYDNKVVVMEGDKERYSFTDGSGDYIDAILSPNENKLVILYGESGLKVCNLDGSNKQIIKVDEPDKVLEGMKWSADEKFIYFNYHMTENTIYMLDIQTKTTSLLTNDFPTYLYNNTFSLKIME